MEQETTLRFPTLTWPGMRTPPEIPEVRIRLEERFGTEVNGWMNRLFLGENLQILTYLKKEFTGQVDLIYIDPPFDSHADYKKKIFLKGEEKNGVVQGKSVQITEAVQYSDVWEEGEYLQFIYERLMAARDLLREGGNVVLHCDWHRDHHLRCLLDMVFGAENFHNEIIYCYSGGGIPRAEMPKKHDVLLWYSKGSGWTYNPQYRSYSEGTMKRGRTAVKGEHAKLRQQGTPVNDWWTDIKKITSPTDPEKLYYPTQKSEELLSRIISMLSNPGDLVLDFFMGSGTTPAAAVKLGRRFLGVDVNPGAVQTCIQRLVYLEKLDSVGFEVYRPEVFEKQDTAMAASIRREEGRLIIQDFCPEKLLKELEGQEAKIIDWRRLVDAVLIDWNYDGEVFCPSTLDVPGRRALVSGKYQIPEQSGRIRVKIVDLLSGVCETEM